ncbi:MAG: NYN domain-containing protein [Sedimentisphaerales bacterium]|nr:NYN domain-containing protein [Sedimentisphaerales bacterium]
MPYLIDGYNLYHAAIKHNEEWSHFAPITLCAWIARDMHILGDLATIVFDGTKPQGRAETVEPERTIKIIYSGPQSDADTVMETLIRKNTAPRRLIVVSSDNKIRKSARQRRCIIMGAKNYCDDLWNRSRLKPPSPKEPRKKYRGVPDGELVQWLEMFGIDPEEPGDITDLIKF